MMRWTTRTAIIVSFALLGCEQPSPPAAEATLIRALAVQTSQFDRTSALTGEIRARRESNLGFRVGGKVTERLVDVGDKVAEGDLLARLDSQDQQNALKSAQSEVAAAQASIEQSRTQEERQRKLLADGYTTRTQYDNAQRRYAQAQADLASAQAKLRSAQDTLSYTELRADRAGVITAKGAEPGQVVASGQMVVRLADPNEREAVVNLPTSALYQTAEGGPAVWVVDQPRDTVSLRPVSVLQYDTGTFTVSSGLEAGETVVIGGSQKLRPGQKVTIRQGS